jgi:SPOR domain/Tetratricopeptide repeat
MTARQMAAAACLTVAFMVPGRLAAQTDSVMRQAVQLATEGLNDSARAIVRARLKATTPGDSTFPEILFTAGIVAGQNDSALYYFRRVSVEFSQSNWADDALLRIAQMAFASGDLDGARRTAERVLSDYPLSDVRARAAFWAGRASLEQNDVVAGCDHLREAQAGADDDVELANQAGFYLQRCANVAATTPTGGADSTRKDSAGRAGASTTAFAVQVAAVRSAAAADELMRPLAAKGYTARVVRDPDGLLKVRVGHLAKRADADKLARELKAKIGGTPFVVEES